MIWQDGWAHGWAEARVHDLLLLLELRGISIPHAVRKQVRNCSNSKQLETWFIRAVTAKTATEVIEGDDGMLAVGHLLPRSTGQAAETGASPRKTTSR